MDKVRCNCRDVEIFWTCQSFGLILKILSDRTIKLFHFPYMEHDLQTFQIRKLQDQINMFYTYNGKVNHFKLGYVVEIGLKVWGSYLLDVLQYT